MNNKGETDGRWRWLPSNQTVLLAFVVLGILLRLRQYLFDRSRIDESRLALNIIRSPAELLKPLDDSQAACRFSLARKTRRALFRQRRNGTPICPPPLRDRLGSAVSRRGAKFLPQPAVPIAVGLLAVSEPLIYYSSEVKQYSSDVAFALILYRAAKLLVEVSSGFAGPMLVALIGGVAIWFSNPAVSILAELGLSAFLDLGKKTRQACIGPALDSGRSLVLQLLGLLHCFPARRYYPVSELFPL